MGIWRLSISCAIKGTNEIFLPEQTAGDHPLGPLHQVRDLNQERDDQRVVAPSVGDVVS